MDELKKWLLNRTGVAQGKAGLDWEERTYAYRAVLEKIEQIESDAGFEKWYNSLVSLQGEYIIYRDLCLQAWKAGSEHANKTGQKLAAQS